ncbi:MAG: helix-turn-helix domain-containing protein [Candidatus Marinimicrobia bacterium]|nr:helix-turn-helix domain-containing protein [Candidatus Neomarinimicrobiota bacterium]
METNGIGDWYSITDALGRLNVSRRTLYDRINKGELQSKKDGEYRFVWVDSTFDMYYETYTDTNGSHKNILTELQNQVQYFKDRCDKLETDLREQSMRHGTTIFQIIQQNQLLLEQGRKPFWKFW